MPLPPGTPGGERREEVAPGVGEHVLMAQWALSIGSPLEDARVLEFAQS
nr:hypothetical protein [Gordonia soli]